MAQCPISSQTAPEFASKVADFDIAADLEPLLGQDFLDGFDQSVLAESYVNGEVAYVPYYFIAISLIYRTDLLEEAGLTAPTTWEEFIKVSEALTVDTTGDGQVDQWGFAMVGTANTSGGSRFVPVMRSFGAVELEADGDGWKTEINSEGGIAALQLWGDLVNKYKVVPPGALNTAYPDALALMSSGKAAMFISGAHAIGGILNNGAEELRGKFSSVPVPAGPGGSPQTQLAQLGYSISKTSEHQEAAAKYLKFFLSKQNQIDFTLATGRIPVRLDAMQSPEIQVPQYQGFVNSAKYAYQTPPASFYIAVQIIAAEAYQAVINGTPAAEAAATAEARILEEISNNE